MKHFLFPLCLLFVVAGCSKAKHDTDYSIDVTNESPYELLVRWQTNSQHGETLLKTSGAESVTDIWSYHHEDVGDLGELNEYQFREVLKTLTVQRISQNGDTIDSNPIDFSDFKYWKLVKGVDDFMGDVEHYYYYDLTFKEGM